LPSNAIAAASFGKPVEGEEQEARSLGLTLPLDEARGFRPERGREIATLGDEFAVAPERGGVQGILRAVRRRPDCR